MALFCFFLFIIGTCFGSFINVVADRIPRKESIFFGKSHCDSCKKKLKPYDMIPVLSYLFLSGRCRYCGREISKRVLIVEVLTGILFVLLFIFSFINWIQYALLCAICLTAIAIALIDMDHRIISDKLLITFGILSVILVLGGSPNVVLHLITASVAFIFFLGIFLITYGRGIGFGDVKYALVIGFLLSPVGLIVAFYTTFLTGAAISIILISIGKKKLKGGSIPFGPFLSLGVIIPLLFENQILQAILPLIGV